MMFINPNVIIGVKSKYKYLCYNIIKDIFDTYNQTLIMPNSSKTKIAVTVLVFFSFLSCTSVAQNVALNAKATVTPVQNYGATKAKNNASFLVNGQTASRTPFWLDSQTLGWQNTGKIQIDLTLQNPETINKVSLITAANKAAGVSLPLNVYVFASADRKAFKLLGDMMTNVSADFTGYKKVPLALTGFNVKAKYVRLVVVPSGAMFFTDEINIQRSNVPVSSVLAAKIDQVSSMADTDIDKLLSTNTNLAVNKNFAAKELQTFGQGAGNKLAVLDRLKQTVNTTGLNDAQYGQFKKGIFKTLVNNAEPTGVVLTDIQSPWEDRNTLLKRLFANAGKIALSQNIVTTVGASEYFSFMLSNNSTAAQNVNLSWNENGRGINVYQAQEVKTRDYQIVNDALVPVNNGGVIALSPGEYKVMTVSVTPDKAGRFTDQITFSSGGSRGTVAVNSQVTGTGLNKTPLQDFTINTWTYFNTPFAKNITDPIRQDMMSHYVNSIVVPPAVMQPLNGTNNLNKFKTYLNNARGFKTVMLFFGFRPRPANFLSAGWKSDFLQWYDNAMAIAKQQGVDMNNLYLYPYDEVKKSELDDYVAFTSWIKGARPAAKIFSTVYYGEATLSRIRPLANVFQFLDRGGNAALNTPASAKTWVYDIMDKSKTLSPYTRYRLLPWKAFNRNLSGIGFWNYADISSNGKAGGSEWDDFDGNRPDYNVVYNLNGKLISSRRWEAFKLGVQDYLLLKAYAAKFGDAKAKQLSASVLNQPANLDAADRARESMIKSLGGVQ
jgi:hypothetical protein